MNDYLDNPTLVEEWLKRLRENERVAFDQGFAVALLAVLEDLVDSKRALISSMLDEEMADTRKMQLASRVHILDKLEQHYKKRLAILSPTF